MVGQSVLASVALSLLAASPHSSLRLRVNYVENPLTIDTPLPRFSYAINHSARAQSQSSYHLLVTNATGATMWDSGNVESNSTLNHVYGGSPLPPDSDFSWTVQWSDTFGTPSLPATSSFSTALFSESDWKGAEWISSNKFGVRNTFRATFTLSTAPVRARLYITGLGYHKTTLIYSRQRLQLGAQHTAVSGGFLTQRVSTRP
jgi:alpha-L-rhamnosidase